MEFVLYGEFKLFSILLNKYNPVSFQRKHNFKTRMLANVYTKQFKVIEFCVYRNGVDSRSVGDKVRVAEDSVDKNKNWKLTEIIELAQCRSLRLLDNLPTSKVCIILG